MTDLFFVPIVFPVQVLSTVSGKPDRSHASNDPLFDLLFVFRVLPDSVFPVELTSSRIPLEPFRCAVLLVTELPVVLTKLNPFSPFDALFPVELPEKLLLIVRPEEFSKRNPLSEFWAAWLPLMVTPVLLVM